MAETYNAADYFQLSDLQGSITKIIKNNYTENYSSVIV